MSFEYIKYGADEARREIICEEMRVTLDVYSIDGLYFHPHEPTIVGIVIGSLQHVLSFEDREEALKAYQLIKKDWDWWREQEALDIGDEDDIQC